MWHRATIVRRVVLSIVRAAVAMSMAMTLTVACTAEEAVPIDPANPPTVADDTPAITHLIPPTPQMEQLARQQCLDDLSLAEGYVQAVDPDTDAVLSEVTVDCDEVRSGDSGG